MEGFEQVSESQANNANFEGPEALSEAVDADLAHLIQCWANLDKGIKAQIMILIG